MTCELIIFGLDKKGKNINKRVFTMNMKVRLKALEQQSTGARRAFKDRQ